MSFNYCLIFYLLNFFLAIRGQLYKWVEFRFLCYRLYRPHGIYSLLVNIVLLYCLWLECLAFYCVYTEI